LSNSPTTVLKCLWAISRSPVPWPEELDRGLSMVLHRSPNIYFRTAELARLGDGFELPTT
jgi:hypothetical protein